MNETRIDRNIIDNVLDLRKFGPDAGLIKAVLFFFAWKHQHSLFDSGTLDLEEFCSVLSLNREHLVIRHQNPKQLQELSASKQLNARLKQIEEHPDDTKLRVFDSVIENALYRLYSENLVFSGKARSYVSHNGDTNEIHPLERIVFLSSLEARHITTKRGQKKIVYDFKLNEDFTKNISLYFAQVNLNHFVVLRKANIEDLYIYLKNLKETLAAKHETVTSTVQFEHLCTIANVQHSVNKARKQLLIKKFKVISEKIDFPVTLEFKVSPGSRWAYNPVISFPATTVSQEDNIQQRREILFQNFLLEMTTLIKNHYPDRTPLSVDFHEDIVAFCKHGSMLVEKAEAYKAAQIKSFITPDAKKMKNANKIAMELIQVNTIEDIKKIVLDFKY